MNEPMLPSKQRPRPAPRRMTPKTIRLVENAVPIEKTPDNTKPMPISSDRRTRSERKPIGTATMSGSSVAMNTTVSILVRLAPK
jgi:hypothetical protein